MFASCIAISQSFTARAVRGKDERGSSGSRAGNSHAGAIDCVTVVLKARLSQTDGIGAKGVREDDPAAGFDVAVRHAAHQFWFAQIPFIDALAKSSAELLQLRAPGAIGKSDRATQAVRKLHQFLSNCEYNPPRRSTFAAAKPRH